MTSCTGTSLLHGVVLNLMQIPDVMRSTKLDGITKHSDAFQESANKTSRYNIYLGDGSLALTVAVSVTGKL